MIKFDMSDISFAVNDCDFFSCQPSMANKEALQLITDLLNELQDIMTDVHAQGFETPEIDRKFKRLKDIGGLS